MSFGNVLIEIDFFPCFLSFADSAARNSRFVVPDSTETVLPARSYSFVMCSGFPFLTMIDWPTLR